MKIGIDMDGVLCDFVHSFNALAKAEFDVELDYPAKSWNWAEWGFSRAGYHTDQSKKAISKLWEIIKNSSFQGAQLPLKGALDAIERLNTLSTNGHDIYFITSRPGRTAKFWSELWLKRHGMDIPTVIIAHAKGVLVRELGLDVFVDDKPENNEAVIEAHKDYGNQCRVYLPDHPYNEWAKDEKQYGIRVADLNAVLDIEFTEERIAA